MTFQPEGRPPLFVIITLYNQKTVTVITDSALDVAQELLRKAAAPDNVRTENPKIVQLRKE